KQSLGIDPATAIDMTLIDPKPGKIPTTMCGPLHDSLCKIGALSMGRSSAGLKGIVIIPGVTDTDYTGLIQVVAYSLYPPLHIPKGSKIAQLVPSPNLTAEVAGTPQTNLQHRGDSGFGSTGDIVCLTLNMQQRPTQKLVLTYGPEQLVLKALLDTGADITIVS
ncbi:POK9 protein, partial [Urocolius indicus]|nr:POK9 protein [Urocolius indicus]